jgi:choline dehydrogenase-like flavoprotein
LPASKAGGTFTASQTLLAQTFARALIPPGRRIPDGYEATVAAIEALLASYSPAAPGWAGRLLGLLDRAALPRTGRRFSKLSSARQAALLDRWGSDPILRWPVQALSFLFKSVHFDRPDYYQALQCVYDKSGRPARTPWLRQVASESDVAGAETIECDVVVVGTGAGGAVVGHGLAARGYAVVIIEEGRLHQRDEFSGNSHRAFRRMYRPHLALGNGAIPIMTGRTVGGSTTINGGTCVRPPAYVLDRWAEQLGTDELTEAGLGPYFERVEARLGVGPTRPDYLGGLARVIVRGCQALGWGHSLVERNAPECDGQGVCTFGCPSDAKRSTNISFLPAALEQGAVLYARMRAHRLLVEAGRAVGVAAKGVRTGVALTVRARAVVMAGGAVQTPVWLLRQDLCGSSGQVGRNLALHPTTMISGLFDETLRAYNAVPQAVSCDELRHEGLLVYGAAAPPDSGATALALNGRPLVEVMDAYERLATLTVIAIDTTSRGRVRHLGRGAALVTYWLSRGDLGRLQRALVHAAEILFAAGAGKVFPLCLPVPVIDGRRGLDAFCDTRLRATDLVLTSVHPLGTCRMARDARAGVVGPDHQAFDVPGLFLVDASVLPTTPWVNPQLIIMALAARAAEKIEALLEA